VFSIVSDESGWLCKFSQISHGSIIRHTWIKKKLEETDGELLELAIIELRRRFQLLSKEVCSFSSGLGWKY
jgi:excinuclease ABC subunit C